MGESVNIDSLARHMIRDAGLVPDVDIKIVYTGLREWEKLNETDMLSDPELSETHYKGIYVKHCSDRDCVPFEKLSVLRQAIDERSGDVRRALKELVTDYNY